MSDDIIPQTPSPNESEPISKRLGSQTTINLTPSQIQRLGYWNVSRRALIQKCWGNKVSPRTAIKLKCLECVGEDVEAITTCCDRTCPLWHHRPFQRKRKATL